MCARTGWTWPHVWSELDWDAVRDLLAHWRLEPPVDALFAAFVGYQPPREPGAPKPKLQLIAQRPSGSIGELRSQFPTGAFGVSDLDNVSRQQRRIPEMPSPKR